MAFDILDRNGRDPSAPRAELEEAIQEVDGRGQGHRVLGRKKIANAGSTSVPSPKREKKVRPEAMNATAITTT